MRKRHYRRSQWEEREETGPNGPFMVSANRTCRNPSTLKVKRPCFHLTGIYQAPTTYQALF